MAKELFGRGVVSAAISIARSVAVLAPIDETLLSNFGGSGNKSARLGYQPAIDFAHTIRINSDVQYRRPIVSTKELADD